MIARMNRMGTFGFVAALATLWFSAPFSAATSAVRVGPIYYGGDNGIFRINADGTGRQRLTRGEDGNPVVSPDGKWIAFTRTRVIGEDFRGDRITTLDLFRVRRDGKGPELILRVAHDPAWSADAKKLAFTKFFGKAASIWTANPDGTGLRRIATRAHDSTGPSWSPDGRRIAFDRWTGDHSEVFVVNADGTGERRLVRGQRMSGVSPSWSPSGTRVAFFTAYCCGPDVDDFMIVVDGEGSVLRKIGHYFGESYSETPEWSPSGRAIAYSQYLDSVNSPNNDHIFVAEASGAKQPDRLAGPNASDPEWSSDGRTIAFVRGGTIFVMGSDGRNVRRVVRAGKFGVGGMDW